MIENTQRDLNGALTNESPIFFCRLGIDTHEVSAAAGTKRNFPVVKTGPGGWALYWGESLLPDAQGAR